MQLSVQMRRPGTGKVFPAKGILYHICRLNCIDSIEDLVIDHDRRSPVTAPETRNFADAYLSLSVALEALLEIGSQRTSSPKVT